MRRIILALILAAGLAGASSAAAVSADQEFQTGETLYQKCSAGPAAADFADRRSSCKGYVLGVFDTLQANQSSAPVSGPPRPPMICLPDVDADQVVETVTRYLADHADQRRSSAPDLVYMALRAAYPCPR
jgi:hypothetical protein